jgi:cell division septation protein DedD
MLIIVIGVLFAVLVATLDHTPAAIAVVLALAITMVTSLVVESSSSDNVQAQTPATVRPSPPPDPRGQMDRACTSAFGGPGGGWANLRDRCQRTGAR